MSMKVFLELVEIRTKVASIFPFLVGLLFTLVYFHEFHFLNTLVFFCGMLIFDLTTTTINNYMDFKKAKSEKYKYEHNVIGREHIPESHVRWLILTMLALTLLCGIYLTVATGWLLLVMGGLVCFIGVFYTYGPIPLSRMPLGELFSGVTMGLGIFTITVYVNVMVQRPFYLNLDFTTGYFSFVGNLWAVIAIGIAALPLVFTIANIMLANNLRDLETDIENHRYTLVYYIGRKSGVQLFQLMMYASYGMVVLGVLGRIYQWPVLLVLLTLPKIHQNLKAHQESLPAPKSFGYAIKNMVLFNSSYVLGLLLCLVWQKVS